MGIVVRRAELDDIDWLLGQLQDFARFFGTKRTLYPDENYARVGVTTMVQQHLTFVAEDVERGILLGFIAGYVLPHPFNPALKLLSEAFWWVDEQFRGSSAGARLLDAFVQWGRENVDIITFGLEHHSPVDDRCLIKRGFHLHERNYLLEV